MRTASRRNSSVYLFAILYLLHSKHCSKETGTKPRQDQRAFDITMDYIQDRKAFGKPIGSFQNSRFVMAALRTRLDAAQTLVDHCVLNHLDGVLSAELAAEVKLLTSELEGEVADQCVQLHGGNGYMQDYEICRLYADARISRIYAGTSEIMKEIIGRGLGLDDRNHRS
ncbi:acyl-CoA dehydrogenase family protein [Halocynthiibacter namhaensis]|uniref:acyl-CoA dehydrogenase family protein n=1 Tax=Halocynthiibacter namhaensis TaxID=1290553 RepID=UPI0009E03722|nr:acyl-CoA dehydrogenase family protein [Halocynthiibacter namhaensis]